MEKSEFKDLVKKTIKSLQEPATPLDSLFDELAGWILGKGQLQVNNAKFQFREIEFYLNNVKDKKSEAGFDPFAHVHNDERFKKTITGSFRPHYSGLDIAIREDDFFGGILIRGVEKIEPKRLILQGPLVSMCAIIGEIGDLTSEIPDSFRLTFESNGDDLKIRATKRIGLGKERHSGGNLENYRNIQWRYYYYENGKDPKGIKDIRDVP
ncbi:MAG: hypothetical protein OHK0019_07400 [Saprospiraceae bacterium]